MSSSILSFGSVNADFQFRVPAHQAHAETVAAQELHRLGGGKAANVALLARRLGCHVRLFGRVGADDLAEQALAPPREAGVDVDGVRRGHGSGTGVAMIAVARGRNYLREIGDHGPTSIFEQSKLDDSRETEFVRTHGPWRAL
ncbi:MAG: PfkB family carbohydrate kinase, partial [Gammaproteobacteria bacterium]